MPNSFNMFAASTSQVITRTVSDSWTWYLIRASGLTAITLLVLLMFFGIGHITGWTYRLVSPVRAWAIHKAMAIMLALSVTVHIVMLLFDHYERFTIAQLFIPFLRNYSNGTTFLGIPMTYLAIPLGIAALYSTYIVTLSSLDTVGWIKRHKKLWQVTHFLSYVSILFALVHVVGAGTDFKETGWKLLALAAFVVILGATVARLLRANIFSRTS